MSSVPLMALWRTHKHSCRPIGSIMLDAREGRLPGITPSPTGYGYNVTDKAKALAAMVEAR